jgi:chromosome segregation ATPase
MNNEGGQAMSEKWNGKCFTECPEPDPEEGTYVGLLVSECIYLNTLVNEKDAEIERWKEATHKHQDEVEALQAEIERLKKRISDAHTVIASFESDASKVEGTARLKAEIGQLHIVTSAANAEEDRLKKIIDNLCNERDAAHGEIVHLKAGEREHKRDEEELRSKIISLELENDDLVRDARLGERELLEVLEKADDFLNDMLARHDGSSDTQKFFDVGSLVHTTLASRNQKEGEKG